MRVQRRTGKARGGQARRLNGMRGLLPLTVLLTMLLVGAWLVGAAGAPPEGAGAPTEPAPRSGPETKVTPELERAVQRGLDYLARTQQPSGAWSDSSYGNSAASSAWP